MRNEAKLGPWTRLRNEAKYRGLALKLRNEANSWGLGRSCGTKPIWNIAPWMHRTFDARAASGADASGFPASERRVFNSRVAVGLGGGWR